MAEVFLYSFNIPFYLFDIMAMLILAVYVWQFKETAGAKAHVYGLLCKVGWMLSVVMILHNREVSETVFWQYARSLFSVMVPYFWYVFIMEISKEKKVRVVEWSVAAIISFNILAVISNPWHRLCWQGSVVTDVGVVLHGGPVLHILRLSSFLICAIIFLVSVRWVLTSTGMRRKQALWFTISNIAILLGIILEIYVPQENIVSPFAMFSLLSAVIISWGFYRWHVYDIMPVAQDVVMRNMREALLVVDEMGYIVKKNSVAEKILSGLPCGVGTSFGKMAAKWPALQQLDKSLPLQTIEVKREYPDEIRYFQLQKTPMEHGGYVLGTVILFKDITEQKEEQDKMLERQKAVAVLAERNRISQRFQDSQGKFPLDVKKQVQQIRMLLMQEQFAEAGEQLSKLSEMSDIAFTDVREVISNLKVSVEKWDFFTILEEWLRGFRKKTGITIIYTKPEFDWREWILPASEVQLLRIIQEVLSIIKKRPKVTQVDVVFAISASWLNVTIADHGDDFSIKQQMIPFDEFGLNILQERAREIGGSCTINLKKMQGTICIVKIPLVKKLEDSLLGL